MQASEVEQKIQEVLPGSDVTAELEGNHCSVWVVWPGFEGLRAVARQQRVYAPLADVIASGVIHAVNIKAQTPAEAGKG